jgi:hypothetical protein
MRQTFKVCPRKIYFRYVAGIQPKDNYIKAKTLGKAYHTGLELLRKGEVITEAIKNVKHLIFMSDLDQGDKQLEGVRLSTYLLGYASRFSSDWYDISRIKTEFKISLNDPFYGEEVCILDALIENDDGTIDIIEDKTTALEQKAIQPSLVLNDQLLNYVDMCEKAGYKIRTMKYRETLKTTTKPKINETIDSYRERIERLYLLDSDKYKEYEVVPLQREMHTFRAEKKLTDLRIDEMVNDYIDQDFWEWPRNTISCLNKFGACEFLNICADRCHSIRSLYETNGKDPLDGNKFLNQYCMIDETNNFLEV